jgi:hypothetical protein
MGKLAIKISCISTTSRMIVKVFARSPNVYAIIRVDRKSSEATKIPTVRILSWLDVLLIGELKMSKEQKSKKESKKTKVESEETKKSKKAKKDPKRHDGPAK